ncbi:ABC transporter permease [Pseudactinotalea sp. Z1739]|uniref:ABC transporter permease n=1 Tax=Pseudactinotalea sp. Z1739 TaxID=3413028 RepID=UPI003C7DA1F2
MTAPTTGDAIEGGLSLKNRRYGIGSSGFVSDWMIFFLVLSVFLLCSIFIDRFFELGNMMNIMRQISFLAIVGLGQFFVIVLGHLDLSVGSAIGLYSVLMAGLVSRNDLPLLVAIALVLVLAALVGLVNGLVTVVGKVPAFITTLVMMNILMGVAFLYSRGLPISGLPSGFNFLGMGYLFSVPVPIYLMLLIGAACYVFTMHTQMGRNFYAVGGNAEASRLSGINVRAITLIGFMLSSVFAAVGAIGLTSRTMAGTASLGEALLFDVITVVVLGGTSLFGGRGNVVGVILAALLIGIISNAMVLLGIDTYFQWIVKGTILIIIVLIDVNSKRR